MHLTALATAAALVLGASPAPVAAPVAAPASKLTLLFTADNWGELAPCG